MSFFAWFRFLAVATCWGCSARSRTAQGGARVERVALPGSEHISVPFGRPQDGQPPQRGRHSLKVAVPLRLLSTQHRRAQSQLRKITASEPDGALTLRVGLEAGDGACTLSQGAALCRTSCVRVLSATLTPRRSPW